MDADLKNEYERQQCSQPITLLYSSFHFVANSDARVEFVQNLTCKIFVCVVVTFYFVACTPALLLTTVSLDTLYILASTCR